MPGPDFSHEEDRRASGAMIVAGVDEVGRGPLAGPVTAAAVILDPRRVPAGIDDSKRLGAGVRQRLAGEIRDAAVVSVAHATVEEIDRLNILRASHLAMVRAVEGLPLTPDHVLVDGNMVPPGLPCAATPLVKGDARSLSIAAASIVAKVARDRVMVELSQHWPGYGWERNAGYPTRMHREALRNLGVTPHHRRSFRTVHNML